MSKSDWVKHMTSCLGKDVRVMLDREDHNAVAEGLLLSFTEDGEVVILDDCGVKHWCWPNLETVVVSDAVV